jgi:hypothetical protein
VTFGRAGFSAEALSPGEEPCLVEGWEGRVALLCGAPTSINILLILRPGGLTSGDTEQKPTSPWYGIFRLATNKLLFILYVITECNTVVDLVSCVERAPRYGFEVFPIIV